MRVSPPAPFWVTPPVPDITPLMLALLDADTVSPYTPRFNVELADKTVPVSVV